MARGSRSVGSICGLPAALLLAAAAYAAPRGAAPAPGEPVRTGALREARRPRPSDGAIFVRQTPPPAKLRAGELAEVSVTLRNSGRTVWTRAAGYKLGSQNPRDNTLWRDGRVELPAESVRPGAEAAFRFAVRAPATPGTYRFQWRMLQEHVRWFGQFTTVVEVEVEAPLAPPVPPPSSARTGPVRLKGWSLADDQGPFNAVGFTLMSGLRLYRSDRAKLDVELDKAARAGYHFVRALSMVGAPPYWQGREIDPGLAIDRAWTDYDEVLAGFLDHAYAKGVRTELTLFADAQTMMPERAARRRHVERVVRLVKPRLQTIAYLEVANEPWQNGFDGTADELAEYGRMLREALPGTVVVLGAPEGEREAEFARKGFPLSLHLDRDVGKADGMWRPVRQPWEASTLGATGWANNEPIGPGSSVAEDRDCERLAAAALTTFISKGFAYVFHTSAGVQSEPARGYPSGLVSDMPCFDQVPLAAAVLPPGQPDYRRENGHWDGAPFKNLDSFIDGGDSSRRGAMRVYSGLSGGDLSAVLLHVPVGIRLECRVSGAVAIYRLKPFDVERTLECSPGTTFELGPGARLLRGAKPDR